MHGETELRQSTMYGRSLTTAKKSVQTNAKTAQSKQGRNITNEL